MQVGGEKTQKNNIEQGDIHSQEVSSLERLVLPAVYSRTNVSPQFITACAKFGADIFITRDYILTGLAHGHAPTMFDVQRFWRDVICFTGDFATKETEPWLRDAIRNIRADAQSWCSAVERGKGALTQEIENQTRTFFAQLVEKYSVVHWNTVLSHIPAAQEMGVLLLDFETRLLGVPQQPLREVAELHNHLLIDPSRKVPQEGFLRVIPAEELFVIGQKRQSRLIGVLKNNELHGFALLTLNNESSIEILGERYQQLRTRGVISDDDVIGWVHLVGSRHEERLSLARKGLNLYSLITPLMKNTALAEGVNILLGCVREGENANTATKAHQRHGWNLTDCTYNGSDGVTPYRVIMNKIAPTAPVLEREPIGYNSYGEAHLNDEALTYKAIEDAGRISDSEVRCICEDYFRDHHWPTKIKFAVGEYFYINLERIVGSGGRHVTLQQIVPHLDQWKLYSNGAKGTLRELLPQAKKALDSVYREGSGDYE